MSNLQEPYQLRVQRRELAALTVPSHIADAVSPPERIECGTVIFGSAERRDALEGYLCERRALFVSGQDARSAGRQILSAGFDFVNWKGR